MSRLAKMEVLGVLIALDASLLILLVVVYVAGIIRGFTGFGSALLIVPALAVVFGPAKAVVIEVLIEVPVTLGLLGSVRSAQRKTVLPMLLMFLVFVPLGAVLLKILDPEPVKIFISIYVLLMVGVLAFQGRLAGFLTPLGVYLTGAISGLTQGMTGMAGPLFATALMARGESSAQTRANILGVVTGIITLSVISFWVVGLLTWETVVYAGIATPAMLLGVWSGSIAFGRLSHLNLRWVILVFLAITAMITLADTLS